MNSSDLFKCVTWNIDMKGGYAQFKAIIENILKVKPDVIFFQEVTDTSLKFLRLELGKRGYAIVEGKQVDYYFLVTAVKTETTRVRGIQVVDFPRSRMRRHLLVTEVEWKERRMHLINAHLESLREYSEERCRQLIKTFNVMRLLEETAPVIFAGDTNLRDKEVSAMGGLPKDIKDMWEELGRPKNCEFTWSTSRTGEGWQFKHSYLRFDRVFFMSKLRGRIAPREIAPLGEEKMPSGHYPSDHIGLFFTFQLG